MGGATIKPPMVDVQSWSGVLVALIIFSVTVDAMVSEAELNQQLLFSLQPAERRSEGASDQPL